MAYVFDRKTKKNGRPRLLIAYVGKWIADVAFGIGDHMRAGGVLTHVGRYRRVDVGAAKTIFIPHSVVMFHYEDSRSFSLMESRDAVKMADDLFKLVKHPFFSGHMIKCQYRRGVTDGIAKPYTYFPKEPKRFDAILERLREKKAGTRKPAGGLYFRGQAWEHRTHILGDINDILAIPVKRMDAIPFDDYYDEIASHRVALSLPGQGNICHREIECFGIGTPVIMPQHINQTHDPLVPGVHYIAVPSVNTNSLQSIRDTAANIRETYKKVKDDHDLLSKVSKNAMDWYDKNVRFPNSAQNAAKLLGLV